MADYLTFSAELGFAEVPTANPQMITAFGCADEESLQALIQEVRDAFNAESVLFRM